MPDRGRRITGLLSAAAAMLAAAGPGRAQLAPQEVLVVANANAKGSVALAKYYCAARSILAEDRLVVLKTAAGLHVERDDYNKNIRDPLRKFLTDNKIDRKIRCLALVWGVPVRVLGPKLTQGQRRIQIAWQAAYQRLHGRAAVNMKLLGTVGLAFPTPRTESLRPLGHLFTPKAVGKLEEPGKLDKLLGKLGDLLRTKELAAAKIADKAKRTIALRQLAGLRLDTYGLAKLLEKLPGEAVPGVPDADGIRKEIAAAEAELSKLLLGEQTPQIVHRIVKLTSTLRGIAGAHKFCQGRILAPGTGEDASVDSELALLWEEGHRLSGALPNPMNWRLRAAATRPANVPKRLIMTARIDGPTLRDALRIIKDSIAAEKTGIAGKFYVDAGGKYPPYDVHLKNVAALVKKYTKVPVVLDTRKEVFPARSCPDAGLYVGWYSVRKYVPAFTWSKGAVGWHVASFEAQHLRSPTSKQWCIKMIQNGVTATCGAVNEPYLAAFPLPEDFFALLLTGHYSVAECYWKTVPHASWRLTLIADPLYNPFRTHPKLTIYRLPPAMTGVKLPTTTKPK